MAYTLSQAADPLAVTEREYAFGAEIRLPGISSCIGVVGKAAGGGVFGIHLGMFSADSTLFALTDIQTVVDRTNALRPAGGGVQIIGETDCWGSANFRTDMLGAIRTAIGNASVNNTGSGSFSVTLSSAGTPVVAAY